MKIFLILAISLMSFSTLLGQQYSYPNEVRGFELFKNGKWKTLIPFVSTKKDVKKIFGQDCQGGCDYDENWRVKTQFIKQVSIALEKGTIPCVSEEFIGKYQRISFYPKKRVKKNQLHFGKGFVGCYGAITFDSSVPDSEYYNDEYGLVFEFYVEAKKSENIRKGDLVAIHYGASFNDSDKYEGKVGC